MPRNYVKRRSAWASAIMAKYFPDWPEWAEQVAIYDMRGFDEATVATVGEMIFTRAMPRADIVAARDGELLVVEIDKQIRVVEVARLLRYVDAMKHDRVRPEWATAKIRPVYVNPGLDVRVRDECRRLGIRYIVEPEPVVK